MAELPESIPGFRILEQARAAIEDAQFLLEGNQEAVFEPRRWLRDGLKNGGCPYLTLFNPI